MPRVAVVRDGVRRERRPPRFEGRPKINAAASAASTDAPAIVPRRDQTRQGLGVESRRLGAESAAAIRRGARTKSGLRTPAERFDSSPQSLAYNPSRPVDMRPPACFCFQGRNIDAHQTGGGLSPTLTSIVGIQKSRIKRELLSIIFDHLPLRGEHQNQRHVHEPPH